MRRYEYEFAEWRRALAHVLLAAWLAASCSDEESAGSAAPATPPKIGHETADALEDLGYVEWASADLSEGSGVVRHLQDRAWPGLNLFSSRNRTDVVLMRNDGEVLHRWQPRDVGILDIAHALPNGDVILVDKLKSIVRLAWDSTELWRVSELWKPHHDVEVAADGTIFALSKRKRNEKYEGKEIRLTDHVIARISPDGLVLSKTMLLDVLGPELVGDRIALGIAINEGRAPEDATFGAAGDILHCNSIRFLEAGASGPWSPGSLLLSFRNIGRVLVVDPQIREVAWSSPAGMLSFQHDATLLPNGHVLVFDNRPYEERSRVVEIDPVTNEITWSYGPEGFFSRTMAGAQRLPNDDVLITDAHSGRCLEVTRAGEIVWEFLNDEVDIAAAKRAAIYRMRRLPLDYFGALVPGQSQDRRTR